MNPFHERLAMKTARNSIIVNILLAAFKLFAGIFARSAAMVSDAVHSITDLISTVVVIIGIKLANQKPDKEHPYGHERFECVATLILAALVFSVGVGIGWAGLRSILSREYTEWVVPGLLALVAAVVSIGVKEALFWYVRAVAKKIDSGALMADAWHSRADGLSSIGSFVGILGARMGFPIMDSLAAMVICVFIFKTAIKIALDAIGKMTDKSCDDATVEQMRQLVLSQTSVEGIDRLKTRLFGNKIYVDVDICVDGALTLNASHTIAEEVHDAIEAAFPKVKHCMVHVNPTQK
ncbi:MAG: cation diffusion facilitator family transporter [Defluviitaleaceae bacterium]|nr:cation diffusion facilitator family transporter [Defluviitaleaceae bacterium]MCL2240178.1 cation diffusion facilitator family transporter [Defluviitaleaceae bacterium]